MGTALLFTPEGRILIAGLAMAFLGIVWMSLNWIWGSDNSEVLIAITATNIIFGRAAGMSVGYTMGLGHSMVVLVNMSIETILVLIFYPLFVFSWRHLLVINAFRNFIEQIKKAAEKHEDTIRKYGSLGLFLFVWFPFWMTGPVVGCAIGFMMRLKPWFNLSVVLAGTYLAIICWAIFLRGIHNRIAVYSPFASLVLTVIVILIVIAGRMLYGLYSDKNSTS